MIVTKEKSPALERDFFLLRRYVKVKFMKKTTTILSDEHKNILKVIGSVLKQCEEIESGKEIDKDFFDKAVDFIRNYADKFHHSKEEDILFVELNKDGVLEHCNPIGQMLHEHSLGRGFVKGLSESVEKGDKAEAVKNARGYCELLQEHIFKEDNILYPMADEALKEDAQKEIAEKFAQISELKFEEKDWE